MMAGRVGQALTRAGWSVSGTSGLVKR